MDLLTFFLKLVYCQTDTSWRSRGTTGGRKSSTTSGMTLSPLMICW